MVAQGNKRSVGRIHSLASKFFKNADNLVFIGMDQEQIDLIKINEESFTEYWYKNYDLRLPQMLYSMTAYDELEPYFNTECEAFITLLEEVDITICQKKDVWNPCSENSKLVASDKSTIILVSGKMRSGKDTATEYIKKSLERNNKKVAHKSFAYELKNTTIVAFTSLFARLHKLRDDMLELTDNKALIELIEKELSFSIDNFYDDKNIISRSLMEIVGTELRKKFVDYLDSINGIDGADEVKSRFWSIITEREIAKEENDVVIISDWRFPAEEISFEKYNVVKIRMDRTFDDQHEEYENPHISEIALDDYEKFDFVVEKQRDIEKLYEILDDIVSGLL